MCYKCDIKESSVYCKYTKGNDLNQADASDKLFVNLEDP